MVLEILDLKFDSNDLDILVYPIRIIVKKKELLKGIMI